MERGARLALTATIIGVVGSAITILVFVTGHSSLREIASELRTPPPVRNDVRIAPPVPADHSTTASPKSTTAPVSPLVTDALAQLETGRTVEYLIQILGPPAVTRREPPNEASGRSEVLYYRFSFRDSCDVQVLATIDHTVFAFVVHGCAYSFPGSSWRLGETSFLSVGDPTTKLVGGDAKFPAYVEKHYFGRAGHYHDFYFAGQWPGLDLDESSLPEVDRASIIVHSVASANAPDGIDAAHMKSWDEYMAQIVGVRVTRFEGL